MLKWFSISGIVSEAKRVRWPNISDLVTKTAKVLFFCFIFALFFMACEAGVAYFLSLIGVGV